jgi:hypothetical protein
MQTKRTTMKKTLLSILLSVLLSISAFAQSPPPGYVVQPYPMLIYKGCTRPISVSSAQQLAQYLAQGWTTNAAVYAGCENPAAAFVDTIAPLPDGSSTLSFLSSLPVSTSGYPMGRVAAWQLLTLNGTMPSGIYATLASAQAAAIAAGKTLMINTALTFSGSLTTTIPISVVPGAGRITQFGTGNLAFGAAFTAVRSQVFFGFLPSQVTFGPGAVSEVYPELWQTNTTPGTTDMTLATQCAINSGTDTSYSGNPSRTVVALFGPIYRWSTLIDLSCRDYIHLKGYGSVQIYSYSPTYVADCTSLANAIIENLVIYGFGTPGPIVGFYFNRATTLHGVAANPYAQYNIIKNVFVVLGTSTTANNNRGTIAYYNSRAELNSVYDSEFWSDLPVLIESTNNADIPPIASGVVAENSINSMSGLGMYNVRMIALGQYTNTEQINGGVGIDHYGCYWARQANQFGASNSGSVVHAIKSNNSENCKFNGIVETWEDFLDIPASSYAYHHDINLTMQSVTNSGGVGFVRVGTGADFSNNTVRIYINAAPSSAKAIYNAEATMTASIKGNTIKVPSSNISMISLVDATARYRGLVTRNIEQSDAQLVSNNIRETWVLGTSVQNGTSLTFPVSVAYQTTITAAYLTNVGVVTDSETISVVYSATSNKLYTVSDTIAGTKNRLAASVVGTNIVFVQSVNDQAEIVGYTIREIFGQ